MDDSEAQPPRLRSSPTITKFCHDCAPTKSKVLRGHRRLSRTVAIMPRRAGACRHRRLHFNRFFKRYFDYSRHSCFSKLLCLRLNFLINIHADINMTIRFVRFFNAARFSLLCIVLAHGVTFVGAQTSASAAAISSDAKAEPKATKAPAILLANVLSADIDVTRYLVSEKYDGARAIWDGRVLKFRSGNVVNAPAWFLAKLPAVPLDGELWLERGQFETLSGIVRKQTPIDSEWQRVKYMIFELPNAAGTFEDRALAIREIVKNANWPSLLAVEQYRVADRKTLKRKLDDVTKAGGEGLMLHLADAPYVTGRSDVLLKLKPQLDTEAVVTAHIPGKGKYAGMMGALEVKTPEGITFKIGTGFSDAQRRHPPAVGSKVTYTYRDLTKNGVPRFASFLRVRDDP